MKEHFCPVEQSVITYQGKCNWCGESEGSMNLYQTKTEPNTITFHNSNADWVMRITADRRIEVNEDVEVSEAAQKVLDAMQYLLKAQRTWVGLTDKEITALFGRFPKYPSEWDDPDFYRLTQAIEAKLKEKNNGV